MDCELDAGASVVMVLVQPRLLSREPGLLPFTLSSKRVQPNFFAERTNNYSRFYLNGGVTGLRYRIMNPEISKQRSPNAPGVPLTDAITVASKLYNAIRGASVKPDVAVKALGYSGLNGAALTTLGMLSQYGLIERSKGMVTISPLAMGILHPLGQSQKDAAIRTAALSPRVFEELNEGFLDCAPGVIENHLIHQGFNPDRAKKVAAVYAENRTFANLQNPSNLPDSPPTMSPSTADIRTRTRNVSSERPLDVNLDLSHVKTEKSLPLARQYRLPLDEDHEVQLFFYGEDVGTEQLEGLSAFLDFMTEQFKKKEAAKAAASIKAAQPEQSEEGRFGGQP